MYIFIYIYTYAHIHIHIYIVIGSAPIDQLLRSSPNCNLPVPNHTWRFADKRALLLALPMCPRVSQN